MRWVTFLGIILVGLLFNGCLFPPHKFRAKEVISEERKLVIWASDRSSIRVFSKVRLRMRPYQGKAGLILLVIQTIDPESRLKFHSEEIGIYFMDKIRDEKIFIPVEENSISNDKLASSRRTTFDVTGIISEEIFRSEIPIDTFYFRLPDIVYEQDTVSIGPIGFYVYHWLDFLFQGQKNKD